MLGKLQRAHQTLSGPFAPAYLRWKQSAQVISILYLWLLTITFTRASKTLKNLTFLYIRLCMIARPQYELKIKYMNVAITNPRQTNTRHDKPQTGKHQTRQTLDITNASYVLCCVMSYFYHVQGMSCPVFVCLRQDKVPHEYLQKYILCSSCI